MRLVILAQYYPPETGAPQSRLSDLATRLHRRGHDVTVVTAMPNYPSGRVFPEWRGRLLARETRDGVVVLRSWLATSARRSTFRQLLAYGTFALSAAVTAPLRLRAADVVLWESTPLFLAPTGYVLAKRLRTPLVMNVSDLWPRAAVEFNVLTDRRLIAVFEALERWAYRSADAVTCQTEAIAAGVRERCPDCRTALFPNGVDPERFDPSRTVAADRARFGLRADSFVVGYVGNFGRAHALHQVVEAAALMADRPDVEFLLMGDGPAHADIVAMSDRLGVTSIRFAAPVPVSDLPGVHAMLDAAVVPLADLALSAGVRSAKFFELAAMELPIVYCGRGEGAEIARRCGSVVLDPERPSQLADALRALADLPLERRREMGRAARAHVVANFDRDVVADEMERLLLDVVANRSSRGTRRG